LTTNVAQVDVKIRYSALSVGTDRLRLIQGVSPSATWDTLRDWTAASVTNIVYEFNSRPEPNDGTWSWTDVNNINVRFEFDEQTTENPTLNAYEIWANVYNTVGAKFYCRPQSNDQSGVSITNPTNAYDLGNSTFASYAIAADGYFNLRNFNTTAGTGTISRVDLRVKYSMTSVSDRYQIHDRVSPSASYRSLLSYVYTDVNIPLETYVWSYRPEANDGNWSWTDVSNIRVRFSTDLVGTANNREIRVYEIWATVYDKPFTATYNVGGVSGMAAWSARITWDPTVIDMISAAKAGFFGGYTTSYQVVINHTGGYADLSETILGVGSTSGSGALANLVFKVLKAGKSRITPTISLLINTQGQNMEHFSEFSRVKTPGVVLIGDFNGDGAVDATDISMFNQQYGKKLGDIGYNDIYDLYDDNKIDAKDLRLIGKNYW
jgi:hypothetical protein